MKIAKKTAAAATILSSFDKRRKNGVTAQFIAEKTGLNLSTTRTVLWQLVKDGQVIVTATVETGERGRPANLYAAA